MTKFYIRFFSILHAIATIALCFGLLDLCLVLAGLGIEIAFNVAALACLVKIGSGKEPAKNGGRCWYIIVTFVLAIIATVAFFVSELVQLIYCMSSTCNSATLFDTLIGGAPLHCWWGMQLSTLLMIFTQLLALFYALVNII